MQLVDWKEMRLLITKIFLQHLFLLRLHWKVGWTKWYKNKLKKNFMAPFYGWGSTVSRIELLRGSSLLFITKFPEIPGIWYNDIYIYTQTYTYIKFHKGNSPSFGSAIQELSWVWLLNLLKIQEMKYVYSFINLFKLILNNYTFISSIYIAVTTELIQL